MGLTYKGAWYLHGYKAPLEGTLGNGLASDSDMLGWAVRSWKYALYKNGYRGAMVLDTPVLGDAARHQIIKFQQAHGLGADGIIGPHTGERLLRVYFQEEEHRYHLPVGLCWQIAAQESGFDLGAVGSQDSNDRGVVQLHIYVVGGVPNLTIAQAVRPAYAVARCAAQMARIAAACDGDYDTAVVSWNCGEGGAEWWHAAGKPAEGSPGWWDEAKYGSLAARCWRYLHDVHSHTLPPGYAPGV